MASESNKQFEVIAERVLTATINGKPFDVSVRFGKPMPNPSGEWACPYQINGLGIETVRRACGIDAVQALQLAMFAAGAVLSTYKKEVKLTFLDEDHLGFPSSTKEASGCCPYCRSGEAE